MSSLSDRVQVAVVTGAGAGIGRAAALKFAAQGMQVLVADVNERAGLETLQLIEQAGGAASFVQLDVTRESDCEAMVDRAMRAHGHLDVAFNNAGIAGYPLLTADHSPAQWQRVIDVNPTGVFNCMKHELIAMKRGGGGAIVNTASIMGLRASAGGSAYCAAKHGVIGLSKAAALEYGRDRIRVNTVCPGYIETAMTRGDDSIFPEKKLDAGVQRSALKRIGQADEVAEMVLWLCSAKASYVTGADFTVDAGVMAG